MLIVAIGGQVSAQQWVRDALAETAFEIVALQGSPHPRSLPPADLVVLLASEMLSTATWIAAARNASYRGAILVVSKPAPAALACACLDAGADDYVRRPLEAIELRSRITALLRRCRPPPVTRATDPALLLDENALALRLGTWSARLRKTSFDLLAYLVERSARWVRSDELRIHVLHTHCAPGASNVRWHVSQARQALGEMSWWLHSDTQRGYMFARQMCDAPHCRRGARRHA